MTEATTDEALDIEDHAALRAYLEASGRVTAGAGVEAHTLRGGVSNRTVLVRLPDGEEWVLKQALPRLRVAAAWFSSPARIRREAAGLRWLGRQLPPGGTPALIFEDPGRDLLAMAAVPRPHENWKAMLLAGRLDAAHVRQFGQLLAAIHHAGSAEQSGARALFADRTFFTTLRLEPYYAYTAARVAAARAFLGALIDETLARRLTVVHGDFSPKNVLVHRGRLILLDHEVIHVGDPAFDLGFALTHLISKAHHLAAARRAFAAAAAQFWGDYRAALGDIPWATGMEARVVRHTLACLLARVDGRSPLEYLTDAERGRQRAAVVSALADPPDTVEGLVALFLARV